MIDTVGFNGKTWLSYNPDPLEASPTSSQLHTVQRLRKSADGNTLTMDVNIEDPAHYDAPFTFYFVRRFSRSRRGQIE